MNCTHNRPNKTCSASHCLGFEGDTFILSATLHTLGGVSAVNSLDLIAKLVPLPGMMHKVKSALIENPRPNKKAGFEMPNNLESRQCCSTYFCPLKVEKKLILSAGILTTSVKKVWRWKNAQILFYSNHLHHVLHLPSTSAIPPIWELAPINISSHSLVQSADVPMLRIILTQRQNLTVGRFPAYGNQPNYPSQRASISAVG